MPTISKAKKEKISEQILHYLFTVSPEAKYTSDIAQELIRDEEFIKSILLELNKSKLIVPISKNSKGIQYLRRQRWRLSNEAYAVYKQHQIVSDKRVTPQNSINSNNFTEDL